MGSLLNQAGDTMQGSFVAPGTVMVEFLGTHSGSCLLSTITLPIKPSLLLGNFWDFFPLEG